MTTISQKLPQLEVRAIKRGQQRGESNDPVGDTQRWSVGVGFRVHGPEGHQG